MSSPSTNLVPELNEECEFSGLMKYECSHCLGTDGLLPSKIEVEYGLVGHPFPASYPGVCVVDEDHRIRKGADIQRVKRLDNPFYTIKGYACKLCIAELPNA